MKNTYEYSEEPYKEIEKKIEALKADFLSEKPSEADKDENEEEKNEDPEGLIPEDTDTPVLQEDPDFLKDFSDKNFVWLAVVAGISFVLMLFITLRKALKK